MTNVLAAVGGFAIGYGISEIVPPPWYWRVVRPTQDVKPEVVVMNCDEPDEESS